MSAAPSTRSKRDGLTRRFGDFVAVDHVTLRIPEGTALRLPRPQRRGQDDDDPHAHDAAAAERRHARSSGATTSSREPLAVRRLVGLVSDETSESQSTWTAREYLAYFARIRHMPDPRAERSSGSSTTSAWTRAFRGKLIGTYSTGMKRRVEIARALMGGPKVLFLDEPTRGLDLPAKREMWKLLRELAAKEEVTTFLSSHDAQEIRRLCSEISVIAQGPHGLHGRDARPRRRPRRVRGAPDRAAHRSITISEKDPGSTGPRPLPPAGAGPNFAAARNTR